MIKRNLKRAIAKYEQIAKDEDYEGNKTVINLDEFLKSDIKKMKKKEEKNPFLESTPIKCNKKTDSFTENKNISDESCEIKTADEFLKKFLSQPSKEIKKNKKEKKFKKKIDKKPSLKKKKNSNKIEKKNNFNLIEKEKNFLKLFEKRNQYSTDEEELSQEFSDEESFNDEEESYSKSEESYVEDESFNEAKNFENRSNFNEESSENDNYEELNYDNDYLNKDFNFGKRNESDIKNYRKNKLYPYENRYGEFKHETIYKQSYQPYLSLEKRNKSNSIKNLVHKSSVKNNIQSFITSFEYQKNATEDLYNLILKSDDHSFNILSNLIKNISKTLDQNNLPDPKIVKPFFHFTPENDIKVTFLFINPDDNYRCPWDKIISANYSNLNILFKEIYQLVYNFDLVKKRKLK